MINSAIKLIRRKELRKNLTPAEAGFWTLIKNKQLFGLRFRRQHSIEHFIVDFVCLSAKLIIELDGAGHFTEAGMAYDAARDARLTSLGYTVLRFENCLVFEDPELIFETVKKAVDKKISI